MQYFDGGDAWFTPLAKIVIDQTLFAATWNTLYYLMLGQRRERRSRFEDRMSQHVTCLGIQGAAAERCLALSCLPTRCAAENLHVVGNQGIKAALELQWSVLRHSKAQNWRESQAWATAIRALVGQLPPQPAIDLSTLLLKVP
jgi:hypothetical protein